MSIRWDPDDPRWLTREPDLAVVDLQVLRQAGIPEPLLFLAVRDTLPASLSHSGAGMLGHRDRGIPFDDVDEPFAEYDEAECKPRRRW